MIFCGSDPHNNAFFKKIKKISIFFEKGIDNPDKMVYNTIVVREQKQTKRKSRTLKRMWKFSSAGRASALQAEGHRFEPYNFHHFLS